MPLNYEEAKKATKNVINYLDTIDFVPYLEEFKGQSVRDMMDKLETIYPYKDEYSKVLFDIISEHRFVKYLNERYKLNIQEVTVYYI